MTLSKVARKVEKGSHSLNYSRAFGDTYSSFPQLLESTVDVAGVAFHASTAVEKQVRPKADLNGVQGSELDAVVRRQPHYENVGNPAFVKEVTQPGRMPVSVIEETAVAIDRSVGSFLEDAVDAGHV